MYANVDFRSGHVSQFQEYSRQGTFFKYWRSHQDCCGLQFHHRSSSEASCFKNFDENMGIQREDCDDNDSFLYMLLQLFAMHKPRLQAPSDYISDVFDSLDPSPQHCSCSFRFKWLELIVAWGSSVIYRPGIVIVIIVIMIRFIITC